MGWHFLSNNKSNMENFLNFAHSITESTNDETPIEERLCRLAATFEGVCHPITDLHFFFFEKRTNPYPNMTGEEAWGTFSSLCKEYQKRMILGTTLDRLREKSQVEVGSTWVKAVGAPPTEKKSITLGDIDGTYTQIEQMARDVSNILVVYTSCEEREQVSNGKKVKTPQVTGLKPDQISNASLYSITVEGTRAFFPVVGGSNTTTRDSMYLKLTEELHAVGTDSVVRQGKAAALILYMMDQLASQKAGKVAIPMRQEFVDLYNTYRYAKMPPKDVLYRFHYTMHRDINGTVTHTHAWQTYLNNRQHTGSGKDGVFSGYSLLDAPPGLAKNLEEAMDLVNTAKNFGFNGVTMYRPNKVLSDILVSSGLFVFCTTLGLKFLRKGDPVGIYFGHSDLVKNMNWVGLNQKSPEIKGEGIHSPAPVFLNLPFTFTYEHIPEMPEKNMYYYPSYKAAAGLCIKTNCDFSIKYVCTIKQLRDRFYRGVLTRAQYIFTRVTFPNVDTMRHYFGFYIILSRTKEGAAMKPDFIETTKHYAASLGGEELEKWNATALFPSDFLMDSHRTTLIKNLSVEGERTPGLTLEQRLYAEAESLTEPVIRTIIAAGSFGDFVLKHKSLLPYYSTMSRSTFFSVLAASKGLNSEVALTSTGDVNLLGDKWAKALSKVPKRNVSSLPPPPMPMVTSTHKTPSELYDDAPTLVMDNLDKKNL